jgi:hypothetical protein
MVMYSAFLLMNKKRLFRQSTKRFMLFHRMRTFNIYSRVQLQKTDGFLPFLSALAPLALK